MPFEGIAWVPASVDNVTIVIGSGQCVRARMGLAGLLLRVLRLQGVQALQPQARTVSQPPELFGPRAGSRPPWLSAHMMTKRMVRT